VKISPENHEFLLQRSMLYLAQKRYQETIQDLTQSLKYRENDPFILYKKGVALYLSLDFKQALYNLLLALENNPYPSYQPDIYYHIGLAWANLEEFEKVIDPLSKVVTGSNSRQSRCASWRLCTTTRGPRHCF
jgi:tetratricopeptide (TPR) repeat protein